jgi:AraC-like DNA-binding protein
MPKNQPVPLKPFPAKPEEGLTFYIRCAIEASSSRTGAAETRTGAVVVGQQTYRQTLRFAHDYQMLHVQFQPGILSKLLRVPMPELLNRNLDARLVLGPEIRELTDRLADLYDYPEIYRLVEDFLWQKIRRVQNSLLPADTLGRLVLNDPHKFDLRYVADQACLSPSQFQRRFVQQVGVPPKFYARMARFYKAFQVKKRYPHLDWLTVACQTGYYDYQHLVRDCREFAGTTPTRLVEEENGSPASVLGVTLQYY